MHLPTLNPTLFPRAPPIFPTVGVHTPYMVLLNHGGWADDMGKGEIGGTGRQIPGSTISRLSWSTSRRGENPREHNNLNLPQTRAQDISRSFCLLYVLCLSVGLCCSVAQAASISKTRNYVTANWMIQSLKKLSQCLAALQRLMQHKSEKLHNNLKIIYVIL